MSAHMSLGLPSYLQQQQPQLDPRLGMGAGSSPLYHSARLAAPQCTQGVPQCAQGISQGTQGISQCTQGMPSCAQGMPQYAQSMPQSYDAYAAHSGLVPPPSFPGASSPQGLLMGRAASGSSGCAPRAADAAQLYGNAASRFGAQGENRLSATSAPFVSSMGGAEPSGVANALALDASASLATTLSAGAPPWAQRGPNVYATQLPSAYSAVNNPYAAEMTQHMAMT
eukprot:6183940-Pleurochrysis_carterae.AAC.1